MDNIFHFGNFEADRERYQLWKETHPIKLERIPLDLLFLLLENQGKLVTRTQIVARLWGDDLFLDTDRSINTAIRKIRRALGDNPQHPRFIETVVAQGYRFVASLAPENWARQPSSDIRADSEGTMTGSSNTEIRLRDFIIEATSETPVLTCIVAVDEVALGRFTLLELDLPADVSLPLKPLGRLLVGLHGVRATLTPDGAQALNVLSTYILQNGRTGVIPVTETLKDKLPLQFAEQAAVGSHG